MGNKERNYKSFHKNRLHHSLHLKRPKHFVERGKSVERNCDTHQPTQCLLVKPGEEESRWLLLSLISSLLE